MKTRARYITLAYAVCLAAITYLDRVAIAVTARDIMRDLSLSQVQMSFVFSAFTLAYGIFEIPTGWWGDRIGPRKVLTRIVIWWSAFTMATAASFSYGSLLLVRFLFGAGEAGAWPNSAKAISRWFPASERGTAQGIFFMGAHLAGGLTPLLVAALLTRVSWRAVFVIFGSVGFLWAMAWFRWFRDDPSLHHQVNSAELAHIQAGREEKSGHHFSRDLWRRLLLSRNMQALCLMYFTQTYGFYFYITWLPTYLEKARGFTSMELGLLAGAPLYLSVVADLFGGLTTDALSRKFGLRIGRCSVGFCSFILAAACMVAATATADRYLAVLLFSVSSGAGNFLLGASWGTCLDIGGRHVGVVGACMNTSGQVGGMLSPVILGYAVQHFASWSAPLYLTGGLYMIGALCWLTIDPAKKLD